MLDDSKVLSSPTTVDETPRDITAPELTAALTDGEDRVG